VTISTNAFDGWLHRYFQAWKSNDPDDVRPLFAHDAVYYVDPFRKPTRGRDKIVDTWVSDPWSQSDQVFDYEILSVAGDTGLARWSGSVVRNTPPAARIELNGILQIEFDGGGRCRVHREWTVKRELPLDAEI
jgi:hypothetical protein